MVQVHAHDCRCLYSSTQAAVRAYCAHAQVSAWRPSQGCGGRERSCARAPHCRHARGGARNVARVPPLGGAAQALAPATMDHRDHRVVGNMVFFTKEQLDDSPSRRDGVSDEEEAALRRMAQQIIIDVCQSMHV